MSRHSRSDVVTDNGGDVVHMSGGVNAMQTQIVYAVMRGTSLHALYEHETDARWKADHLNTIFRRGTPHTVVPMPVQKNNATQA